jgi:hypothetical protein
MSSTSGALGSRLLEEITFRVRAHDRTVRES